MQPSRQFWLGFFFLGLVNPAFAEGCIFARDDAKIVCVPLVQGR